MKPNRIRFDIVRKPELEAGKFRLKTGDGREVEILKWDYTTNDEYIIIGLIDCGSYQRPSFWDIQGNCKGSSSSSDDLFLYQSDEDSVIEKLKAYFDGVSGEEARRKFKEILEIIEDKLG